MNDNKLLGAPRSMKMGTTRSLSPCDGQARRHPPSTVTATDYDPTLRVFTFGVERTSRDPNAPAAIADG